MADQMATSDRPSGSRTKMLCCAIIYGSFYWSSSFMEGWLADTPSVFTVGQLCVWQLLYVYQNKKNAIIQNDTASEWLKRQFISTPDFLCMPYTNVVNWYMLSSPIDLMNLLWPKYKTSRVPIFNLLFHFHFAFGFIDTISHIDVITWKNFPHYLPFVRGTHL